MRFAGIDIAAETHVVAIVDETGTPVVKPTPFTEDAEGYVRLLERLGPAADLLVVMEATGHYWQNLFATLAAHRDELEGFERSKGTIRFQPGKPLPAGLVRKLVKARIAENSR